MRRREVDVWRDECRDEWRREVDVWRDVCRGM